MLEENIKLLDDFNKLSTKSQKVFLKMLRLVKKKNALSKIRLLCMRLSLKASIKISLWQYAVLRILKKKNKPTDGKTKMKAGKEIEREKDR